MEALLGVDVGTTNTKLRVYSVEGLLLAENNFVTPFHRDADGGYYQPDEIAHRLIDSITHLPGDIKRQIVALSIASFAESIVGVDSHGTALTKSIVWYDTRTKEYVARINKLIGSEEVYRHTGLLPHYIYSFYKLLWYRDTDAKTYRSVRYWTSISGYILFLLSGRHSFDYSLASRTMLFDQRRRDWWDKLLELAGITKNSLAPLFPSGSSLGSMQKEIAEVTGLHNGVQVVTGGHDHLCGALSAGVFKEGRALISSGTTESLTMALEDIPEEKIDNSSQSKPAFWWGHHVAFPFYYAMNGLYSGGYSIEWILNIINGDYSLYTDMPFPDELPPFFIPYLRGADYSEARGAFLNLSDAADKKALLQGVVFGLCFELRSLWDTMITALPVQPDVVTNIGGGTKNGYWMKIKATVLGTEIIVPKDTEGTAKGAALLAGIGVDIYNNAESAYKKTFKRDNIYKPLAMMKNKVDRWYNVYRELLADIKNINKKIL